MLEQYYCRPFKKQRVVETADVEPDLPGMPARNRSSDNAESHGDKSKAPVKEEAVMRLDNDSTRSNGGTPSGSCDLSDAGAIRDVLKSSTVHVLLPLVASVATILQDRVSSSILRHSYHVYDYSAAEALVSLPCKLHSGLLLQRSDN